MNSICYYHFVVRCLFSMLYVGNCIHNKNVFKYINYNFLLDSFTFILCVLFTSTHVQAYQYVIASTVCLMAKFIYFLKYSALIPMTSNLNERKCSTEKYSSLFIMSIRRTAHYYVHSK